MAMGEFPLIDSLEEVLRQPTSSQIDRAAIFGALDGLLF